MARKGARHGKAPGAQLVNTAVWEVSGAHMFAVSSPGADAVQAGRPQTAIPGGPIWWRGGPGLRLLALLGRAHLVAGLAVAAAGLLTWYLVAPGAWQLTALAGAGASVALAGAADLWLARRADAARLTARAALPAADLLAACVAFWALGQTGGAATLLILPVALATMLLGWRAGAAAAGSGALVVGAAELARGGLPVDALAIGLAGGLTVAWLGVYAGQLEGVVNALLARSRHVERELGERGAEQTRLLSGLRLLEETHRRLERERAELDQQIVELARIVQRVAEGDLSAAQHLHAGALRAVPGSDALGGLATGIEQLTHQMTLVASSWPQATPSQRVAEGLAGMVAEQGQLLRATDTALHDQSAVANQLVAELQLLAHGNGEAARQAPAAIAETLRGVEQLALGHASSTAMLGARMAQLRARHDEIEIRLRRLAGVPSGPTGGLPLSGGAPGLALEVELPARGRPIATTPRAPAMFGYDQV
jgi:hypothetical protein